MTVGSRILRSTAARFSTLDIDEPVTIEGAGHHRTTVEDLADDVTVVLAEPAQRTGDRRSGRRVAPGVGLRAAAAGHAADRRPPPAARSRSSSVPGVYDFTALRAPSGHWSSPA